MGSFGKEIINIKFSKNVQKHCVFGGLVAFHSLEEVARSAFQASKALPAFGVVSWPLQPFSVWKSMHSHPFLVCHARSQVGT